jgi:5-methylcytosine-specific restriction protein A
MPQRAPHACPTPGCPHLAYKPGPCANCASTREQARGSASSRGYGARWRALRALVLQSEPLCRDCQAEGRVTPATDVDHILAREKGGTDERSNLAPRCHAHHSAKTVREDGGFGRMRASA